MVLKKDFVAPPFDGFNGSLRETRIGAIEDPQPIASGSLDLTQERIIAFSAIASTGNGTEVNVAGRSFTLNVGSSPGAMLEVSLDDAQSFVTLTPGSAFAPPRPFTRAFLRRPSTVPSDAARFFRIAISQNPGQLVQGPLPIGYEQTGADNLDTTALPLTLASQPTLVLAAAVRRRAFVQNVSPDGEVVYVTKDSTAVGFAADTGLIAVLYNAGDWTPPIDWTGAIYAYGSAATAVVIAYAPRG